MVPVGIFREAMEFSTRLTRDKVYHEGQGLPLRLHTQVPPRTINQNRESKNACISPCDEVGARVVGAGVVSLGAGVVSLGAGRDYQQSNGI